MKEDEIFELSVAFDLIPHVIGASWATTWFRMNKIKKPTAQQFREKVVEFLRMHESSFKSFPDNENFKEISEFIEKRYNKEIENVLEGKNKEIEKRYNRYIDYG